MRIFVPRETKTHEYRVALVPASVGQLVQDGHEVWVGAGAGLGAGITDAEFSAQGASIVDSPEAGAEFAELMVKVKEPLAHEWHLLREGLVVFGYFHFAASEELTLKVRDSGCTAVAYETLVDDAGRLPLLIPMSEVAGRMSIQAGAKYLENPQGGRGVLLGGVPGVAPAHVTILGAGVVGTEAAKMAAGLGARVHLLDNNLSRLRALSETLPANVVTIFSNQAAIREELAVADLVVGAVLVRGARAPHLISREQMRTMKRGAVFVDVAIDQGGCAETSRVTTHAEPTYVEEGVVHYCVANIPGAVSRTSTFALSNATLPYVRRIAAHGLALACSQFPELVSAINIHRHKITHSAVSSAFGLEHGDLGDFEVRARP